MADREPIGAGSRPSGEMQSFGSPPATPHSTHDLLLLAAAADRDPDPTIAAAAEAQVARCPECATIASELRSVTSGLSALPKTRPAPRDMRLTPEQAGRLGRGRIWRRLLRPFGADGLPGLRPVAATLMTLGLAGIVLTAFPLGFGAGTAALPASNDMSAPGAGAYSGGLGPAAASAAGAEQPGTKFGASSAPELTSDSVAGRPLAPGASAPRDSERSRAALQIDDGGPRLPPLTLVSIGFVIAGLGLFTVLFIARRIA